jgi:hypothetical protein
VSIREVVVEKIEKSPLKALLLFFLCLGVLVPWVFSIKSNFTVRSWFSPESELIERLNKFEEKFQSDENILMAFYHPDGVIQTDILKVMAKAHEKLWLVPNISRVDSAFNAVEIFGQENQINIEELISTDSIDDEVTKRLQAKLKIDNQWDYQIFSPDRKMALVLGGIRSSNKDEDKAVLIVKEVNKLIADLDLPKGLEVLVFGSMKGREVFEVISFDDNKKILPVSLSFVVLLILFLYRSWFAVILIFGLIGSSIISTFGALGFFSHFFQWEYSSLLSSLPGILVAICIADSVHLLESLVLFQAQGLDKRTALRKSLEKNFLSTFLTSFTTAVGFVSLMVSDISPIYYLGGLAGFGALLAWVYTYLFVGGGLFLVINFSEKKGLWPVRSFKLGWSFSRLANFTRDFRKFILLFGVVIFALFTYVSMQNKADSDPVAYFSDGLEIKKTTEKVRKYLKLKSSMSVQIDSSKVDGIKDAEFFNKVDKLNDWILTNSKILKTSSILDDLKKLHQASEGGDKKYFSIPQNNKTIAELLFFFSLGLPEGVDLNLLFTPDYRFMKINVLLSTSLTSEIKVISSDILSKAKELGLNASTEGAFDIYQNINVQVVKTFITSILSALVIIAIIVFLFLGDFKLAVLSIIPNLFSLITTGFFIKTFGLYLDIGTSIVSAICLGISIDDTIHFITHFHENKKLGMTTHQAVTKTLNDVGQALIVTTIILSACFLCYLAADFRPSQNFGLLSSLTMAFALLADLILLPAIIYFRAREEK